MIIDIHTHLAQYYDKPKKLAHLMDVAERFDIQRFCSFMGSLPLSQQPTQREIRQANDLTLALMKRYKDRVVGFCYLNPNHTRTCIDELNRCMEAGMRGVKFWVAALCNEPIVFPIIERAIELDVPVLQHAWKHTDKSLKRESEPAHIADLAGRYPQVKLIMAHAPAAWQYAIKMVRPYDNVVVDTSGANATQGFMEMALHELGAERIVFGSDVPKARGFASQLAKVDGVKMSKTARRLILAENARKLLKL